MSGETKANVSGWGVDTLKEYFDTLRAADKEAVAAALDATEKAITKKEAADEKRFESVNEFRGTLADQAANFLTRAEYDAAHDNLVQRVNDLQDRMNRNDGKGQGSTAFAGWAVAAVSLVISVISVIIAANAIFSK